VIGRAESSEERERMSEKHFALRDRTKRFALRVIKPCDSLPGTDAGRTISRQILRSGTSVAANYRAVGRARSQAEFVAKMGVVVEEADETVFWLELLAESDIVPEHRLGELTAEANELVAIFVMSQPNARRMSTKRSRKVVCSPDLPINRSPE
jgi:four helix bundle protein